MRRLLVILLTTLMLTAPGVPGTEASEPTGTVRICMGQPVESLDPAQAAIEAARTVIVNIYERLYDYHYLKRPLELEPCLASHAPEVSEDGLTWTVRLRKDVRFADDPCFPGGKGRPLTAGDVVFSLKRLLDAHQKSPGRWVFGGKIAGLDAFRAASAKVKEDPNRDAYTMEAGYPDVPGLRTPDAHTLVLHLVRPYPDFGYLLASHYASVYPHEAVKKYGKDLGRHAVGTGPYTVRSFLPGKSVVLIRNESYRERTYPSEGRSGDAQLGILADAGRKLPLNQMVVVAFDEDVQAGWNRFLRGRSDTYTMPPSVVPVAFDIAKRELLPHLKKKNIGLHANPRLEIFYLAFNMQDAVFGHPGGEKGLAIRRAICLADDVTWEIQQLYRNMVIPVEGPVLEELPESDLHWTAPWVRQPTESLEEVQEAAREVLSEAGYTADNPVPPLEIDVLDFPGTRQAHAELAKNMKAIGIELVPNYVEWKTLRKRIADGKARMWRLSWEADYPTARSFLELFYAPGNPDPVGGRYANPDYDELYEEARDLPPGEERTDLYRQMQEMIAQDCPWRFRYRRLQLDVTHAWLKNYRHNEIVPRFFEFLRVDPGLRAQYKN